MHFFAPRFWYEKKLPWWHFCLKPLAAFYVFVVHCRRFVYQKTFFKSPPFSVPVIVVGNLTVGGSGKTPFVIWLVNQLKEAGYRPGIISRGYGGCAPHYPLPIRLNMPVTWTGDEPRLLCEKTGCPVVIDPRRKKAAQYLQDHTDCNIIISDDGLQHYALYRDITIVLLDGHKRIGNGYPLPAGPLREPLNCLQDDILKVCKDGAATPGEWQATTCYEEKLYSLKGEHSIFLSELLSLKPTDFWEGNAVENLKGRGITVHAVAGIAHPEYFFEMLESQGFDVIRHPFPDHHPFQESDFSFITSHSIIIMTEKDAVKCRALNHLLENSKHVFYWPITLRLEDHFWNTLLARIEKRT